MASGCTSAEFLLYTSCPAKAESTLGLLPGRGAGYRLAAPFRGALVGSEPAIGRTSIRFGKDFELDLRACELRKASRTVRLQRRPMDLLLLLVEHRDRLVTREEIIERLWGKDVFLDTENGINTAVRKLRAALGDDPEQPRCIQTVPSRGYRFIASIENHEPPSPSIVSPPGVSAGTGPVRANRRWLLPVAVSWVLLAVAGAYSLFRRPRPVSPSTPSRMMLAVLPFENLTGDPGQEYFSDGVTEETITQLGSLDAQRLGVIARTSVMGYKGTHKQVAQIGHELGVQYVLEGSVRRDGDRVRISAQLIQVKDQTHLWAHEYDYELRDLLAVQAEIARAVAEEIQLGVTEGRRGIRVGQPFPLSPQALQAYDLYLKGRYAWNQRTPAGFQQAIDYFQQATTKDPGDARAYAGLADTYALLASYDLAPEGELIPKARLAAQRALQIDETSAEAHVSLALITENYDWNWAGAEKEFRRAIELDPNYATAHQWYAEFLAFQGRFGEAMAESGIARQLDPFSLIIAADQGAILYFSRRYNQAIQQFQAVLKVDPGDRRAQLIVYSYVLEKKYEKALADIASFRRFDDGPWPWALEAYAHGSEGKMTLAKHDFQELQQAIRKTKTDPTPLLTIAYLGLGDKNQALACLEEGFGSRSNTLTTLKVDPVYDPLRSDPRFEDLLRRVGLPE